MVKAEEGIQLKSIDLNLHLEHHQSAVEAFEADHQRDFDARASTLRDSIQQELGVEVSALRAEVDHLNHELSSEANLSSIVTSIADSLSGFKKCHEVLNEEVRSAARAISSDILSAVLREVPKFRLEAVLEEARPGNQILPDETALKNTIDQLVEQYGCPEDLPPPETKNA